MAINPKYPDELFIGTGSAQHDLLFKSTDGGDNWFPFTNGLPDSGHVKCILIDTINNKIFIGVNAHNAQGIYIQDILTSISDDSKRTHISVLPQNYPNPFNTSTIITYDLPERVYVSLTVYDVLGKEVNHLVNGCQPAGNYRVELNAVGLPGGVYYYCLKAGTRRFIRKALLIK